MGDSLKIPDDLPQPKNVYMEQIEILKPLLKSESKSESKAEVKTKKTSPRATKMDISDQPSTSSASQITRVSSKGKITTYTADQECQIQSAPPGSTLAKLEKAAPYNIFFTTIIKASETLTQPNAITFTGKETFCLFGLTLLCMYIFFILDLLCPSLGELKCSLQINFMIDIDWLLKQYKARNLQYVVFPKSQTCNNIFF